MSIGIGVGDFIKVSELIHQARKRFVDAPSQYDTISKENFHNVILDIDILSSEWEPDIQQRAKLQKVKDDSIYLLNGLFAKLDKHRVLATSSTGMVQYAKKAWKRLNWNHDDIQEFRRQLSLHLGLLGAVERQIHSQRFSRMEQKTDHITKRVNHQHLNEILGWFGPSNNGSRQSSLLEKHQEGTCEWFLASNEFQDWIKTKDRILFCPGLPGAGKTVLVSFVIQYLQILLDNDSNTGIAYHYCDLRHQNSETVNLILSNILKQLAQCQESLPDAMETLHSMHKKRDTRPSPREIKIIDGLDECLVWRELMTELRQLRGVNILTTSRFISEISNDKALEGSTLLEVNARDTDIRKYLNGNMLKLDKSVAINPQLQEDVCKAILGASGGMFLLARLHLDSLAGLFPVKKLKDALSTLPTGTSAYDEAYQCALERIESQHEHRVSIAKDVLAWLTFVKRPLTIEELRTAVIIQETDLDIDEDCLMDIENMVSACAGLVAVDEQNGKVTLIHYTTEEYLRRKWPTWANTHLNADMVIATTCLTYLLFPVFDVDFTKMDRLSQSKEPGRQVYPLLEYSLKHGALHARVADTNCPAIDRFRSSDSKVSKTWLLMNTKYGEGEGAGTAEWLIEQGVTASVRDSEGRTAFHYAVLNGWARSTECLLKRGAIMNSDFKNMTPFHYAVSTGNEAIVKAFLSAGVPADMPVTRQLHTSPCQENKAIYVTRGNRQIVLDNSCSEQGLTPLHLAAMTGSQKMTKFLLDHGANPNFPSHSGETPLHLAMKEDLYGSRWQNKLDFWNNPDNRVECVLEWIDPEEDEENYYSTKAWIRKERSAVVELLLNNPKTDVNAQDIFGMSPLHIAAGRKDLTALVFQKLIDRGADISLCTTESRTPLHLAIMNKNVIAVSYLLKIGADPRAEDANGLNTLHYAAQTRHLQILQNLLATIPDIQMEAFLNRQDKKGKNALHHLLRKHGVEIPVTRYLLERCNGINDLDSTGMSPVALYISANVLFSRQDDKHLLDLLFSYGADPSFKTTEGLGLVHLVGTSRRCSVGGLQTLAKWGIDLRSLDTQGRTVLHHSSITGTLVEDVLHFLCHDIKLSVNLRDVHGKTALDYAVQEKENAHDPNPFDPGRWIRAEKLLRGVEMEV
ncbi:isoform 2 of ankyrin-3 [Fusarium mexicanum]|uniref:Isoform 2 of ankyrin-3 n=1 Tax=Fusarium mexicanum TaxID=751941 RepID=A0A8H5JCI3_9HYPO|nr:isoform 2 of ankyrin-3 [Fusarium mexicanum]